jgi:hypothetical protein
MTDHQADRRWPNLGKSEHSRLAPLWLWLVLLVIGLILSMFLFWIINVAYRSICSSFGIGHSTRNRGIQSRYWDEHTAEECASSSTGLFTTPLVSILLNAVIWLFFGVLSDGIQFPVWGVFLYIVAYQAITSLVLAPLLPTLYQANWAKSIIDIFVSVASYTVGEILRCRAVRIGREREREDFSPTRCSRLER